MPQMIMDHGDVDPAVELQEKLGYVDDVEIPMSKVLLAIYIMPTKTKSGIELPDSTRDENLYQGKACLVVKRGPTAFKDDEKYSFHGFDPQPGEWVMIRPSDGLKFDINKTRCVLVEDTQIKMKIPSPDMVW